VNEGGGPQPQHFGEAKDVARQDVGNAAGSFRTMGLSPATMDAVERAGYTTPTPVQAGLIPKALTGIDVLGQARTGTGKTASFVLPILERMLHPGRGGGARALVLVPTRELAVQVRDEFEKLAHGSRIHCVAVYGGKPIKGQIDKLAKHPAVVVGTPGRLIDHMERGSMSLGSLDLLVLDEADEMLRMGFIDEVEQIFAAAPDSCQVALFSATLPAPIRRIAQKHLRSPVEVTIKSKTSTAANIRQRYWVVSGVHKLDALTRILEAEDFDGMLIFARMHQRRPSGVPASMSSKRATFSATVKCGNSA
jgi:ATP-dependent RNA helicase DeaD